MTVMGFFMDSGQLPTITSKNLCNSVKKLARKDTKNEPKRTKETNKQNQ